MLERSFDDTCGIVRVKASGPWTLSDLDDHYTKLRELIDGLRAKAVPIRVLIDVRHAPSRPADIEARISENGASTYQPGDRIAILTADAEDKAHVRMFLDGVGKWGWQ